MDHAAHSIAPRLTVALFLSLILLAPSTSASAQQPSSKPSEDGERGIQLYQQGDAKGAIELLRQAVKLHKDDISAWHYLGLAFAQAGKKDDARKAHEKAARIAEALLNDSLDRAVTL